MSSENRDQVLSIISNVLGVPLSEIDDNASPDTISNWDSIAHLNLIVAIEAEFGITFSPEETLALTSVSELQCGVKEKLVD